MATRIAVTVENNRNKEIATKAHLAYRNLLANRWIVAMRALTEVLNKSHAAKLAYAITRIEISTRATFLPTKGPGAEV